MGSNLSPEEKLLRLIKGPKKTSFSKAVPRIPVRTGGFGLQKIILAALILSSMYLAYALVYPLAAPKEILLSQAGGSSIEAIEPELPGAGKPVGFYQQEIEKRRIFNNERAVLPGQNPVSRAGADITKDINLVGIISEEPVQAVIEDLKTRKTYYLSKGEFIGPLKVEDIQEGKVVLDYNGQRCELYL